MNRWTTLSREVILNHSKYLVVENHAVRLPDGRVIADWPWIILPDYINVMAETDDGRFICFRQNKYAIDGTALAPVGGYLEPGEDPLTCARRELREETGYESDDWTPLGSYACDGNRGAGHAHFFLARRARKVTEPVQDDLEDQELLLLTRPEVEQALDEGQFAVLGWAAVAAIALQRIQRLDIAIDPGS